MASAGTSNRSDWREGFLFVGNDVALDFLNTCPIQNGEPLELLSDFKALLRWFRAAGLVTPRQAGHLERQWGGLPRARQVTEAMRELRERIRKEVLAWKTPGPSIAARLMN